MEQKEKIIKSSFWANVFKTPPEKMELLNIIKEMPPFSDLRKSFFKEILNIVHHRNYVKGEYIFYQSDPGIGLYIINEGEVEIEYDTPKKKKIILATFGKGDFFGELALLDGERRSASAIAKSDCKIAIIFKPDLDELILKNPKEGVLILSGISKIIITRLRHLNNEYLSLQDNFLDTKEIQNGTIDKKNISAD